MILNLIIGIVLFYVFSKYGVFDAIEFTLISFFKRKFDR